MARRSTMKMAQFGVGHGHAAGKMRAMRSNPEVEVAGVFEPDPALRTEAETQRPYEGVHWFRSSEELLSDPSITAVAIEGRNADSLPMAIASAAAGKHLWY